MHTIADTRRLVADGVISADQAKIIEARARQAMVSLIVNTLLCGGILVALVGIFEILDSPALIAGCGGVGLVLGVLILAYGGEMVRMFGNASVLIGAGILLYGISVELADQYENIAGAVMTVGGIAIMGVTAWALSLKGFSAQFVTGAILLMGVCVHISGLGYFFYTPSLSPLVNSILFLYISAIFVAAGWVTNVRLVTAFAIVPFFLMLYILDEARFNMNCVFVIPEKTLSLVQMSVLFIACIWISGRTNERIARHARTLAFMGFIVANICALSGSICGDIVGDYVWGPGSYSVPYYNDRYETVEAWRLARDRFEESALIITSGVYTILWAIALVAFILWSAHKNMRALFNTAMLFAALNAFIQISVVLGDGPFAYIVYGLAAIPLAWGIWRLNLWLAKRTERLADP